MTKLNIISQNPESTLVAEFVPDQKRERNYQSEAMLEDAFIKQLQEQGYEYLPSDPDWEAFFRVHLANQNDGILEKTNTIQNDFVKVATVSQPDGSNTFCNIKLIDKDDIHRNSLQVINQYVVDNGSRPNRYDVTILVNGLPLVHVELKRRGVDLKEAFNQINR